ncbi:hypothetical protein COZ78_01160 [bacterium (Candidatus Gribaldobacteria) CG_4_8_14_3_um_filter_42_11]|uniref:DUF86 domain-containing protein n=2 Tax=Candidatus Gribaldobacteria TaxID=2798536 RepID=A0A2M7IYM3_9BACT|nr:MAG: hypothetical protein AUJ36_00360 [Parcubacteria group bacterium CG1_02_41_26]PIV47185.1 MAG: hypothetical protein COS21_01270 [bacterium (Candidatus Gribaldobacteria) CG02_land_8_20_14_3_00_41_15]PIX03277.1 MAG: hypothetical protein COZ78_01160 [bacterium (Candidatus Gribaldobacteria) CG_4_8_14_3_um_filter_42_11]
MNDKLTIDREKIIACVEDIKNALLELGKIPNKTMADFAADKNYFYLASYWLRIAIEGVLTIGTHILSRMPANGQQKNYTQIILSLADYGILPRDFAQKIKGMAGYRNRLARLYWNVSKEEVLNTLQNELSDFQKFVGYIEDFLAKQ